MRATAGELTALAYGPRRLRIEGWVSSLAGGELDGFEVLLGTQKQSGLEWRSHRSNFQIVGRVSPRTDTSTLVTVIPHFAGRSTRPLFSALEHPIPLPPKRDQKAVAGDFVPKAFRSLSLLVSLARLARDGSILDVGCGVGRTTYALSHYLSGRGRYEGFDAVPRWIEWNRKTIGARIPHFRFQLAAVENGLYSRRSRTSADGLRFPYKDGTFDTALVESVFQHNRVPVVRHYLAEIGRVLCSGGRCVVTGFLLRRGLLQADRRADGLDFLHPLEDAGAWSASPRIPEMGIAFEAAHFKRWVAEAGLDLAEFHRGEWHGEGTGIAYQDVIVLEKPRGNRRRAASRRRR